MFICFREVCWFIKIIDMFLFLLIKVVVYVGIIFIEVSF